MINSYYSKVVVAHAMMIHPQNLSKLVIDSNFQSAQVCDRWYPYWFKIYSVVTLEGTR